MEKVTRNENSLDAYHHVKKSGMLTLRANEVYEALYHYGAMTQNEVVAIYKRAQPDMNQTSYTSRFGSMVDMDVIEIVGSKKDSYSGRSCAIYDITGRTPHKLKKKLTNVEKYNLALDFMNDKDILMEFSTLLDKATKEKNK